MSTYSIGVGDFNVHLYSKKIASWAQDDWQISNRLTLNLGLRYDLELGAFANNVSLPPFQQAGRPADKTNFQPRLGFNYKVNDKTVLRGGSGLYYGDALGADQSFATGQPADRRDQLHQRRPAGLRREPDERPAVADLRSAGPITRLSAPSQHGAPQTSPGLRRVSRATSRNLSGCRSTSTCRARSRPPLASSGRSATSQRSRPTTSTSKGTHEKDVVDNINLTFDPATGVNLPFANRATRPFPDWGVVSMNTHLGRSAYHALQTSVNKRFSNHWQGVGDLHAVGPLERRHEAVQRPRADHLRDGSRPGRRVGLLG